MRGSKTDYKNVGRDIIMFIGNRDAQMLIQKLQKRSANLPNFSFEFSEVNGELRSLFWADGVAKVNYNAFGDVLAFDATYSTNKYNMIFVPFTGVDHHKKCATFGAGLIYSETVESYTWLLNCFLKAHKKQLTLVLTDQDPSMKQAVSCVFHESLHRLCMWHIMKKLPSKISGNLYDNTNIRASIHKLVWNIYIKPSTFEERWQRLMIEFNLTEHVWLNDMYAMRASWVPAYFREIPLCCLMKTTSRCESSNAQFKVNSSATNTLVQFLLCFDSAIDQQRYNQRVIEHKTNTTIRDFRTGLAIEKHASDVYTQTIFSEVQKEIVKGMMFCFIISVEVMEGMKIFTVAHTDKRSDIVNEFKVKLHLEDNAGVSFLKKSGSSFNAMKLHSSCVLSMIEISAYFKSKVIR
ncbi:hypothetical protein L1987_53204 [Smallanthus sonchifolius]|uniref:Uncharacterized protein n=1 Tax=Smallanthus sonchifolius TaxID=185202 RepID=A0ACB9EVV8_9ASTR|nr:hypothetical protein L1987_53204 [Smallanthus sonchifolius]